MGESNDMGTMSVVVGIGDNNSDVVGTTGDDNVDIDIVVLGVVGGTSPDVLSSSVLKGDS